MNRWNVPDIRNPPLNEPPYNNHIRFYSTATHEHLLLAMDNDQLISDRRHGNQINLANSIGQRYQYLEDFLSRHAQNSRHGDRVGAD